MRECVCVCISSRAGVCGGCDVNRRRCGSGGGNEVKKGWSFRSRGVCIVES